MKRGRITRLDSIGETLYLRARSQRDVPVFEFSCAQDFYRDEMVDLLNQMIDLADPPEPDRPPLRLENGDGTVAASVADWFAQKPKPREDAKARRRRSTMAVVR